MNLRQLFLSTILPLVTVIFNFAEAQNLNFPIPKGNAKQLFFLQRTPNTNTIVCELNFTDGIVDKDDPVHMFWIRYQDKGQYEDLNYVQRKFAYGINSKEIGANKYELNFVSYKKYKMILMQGIDKQYHVFTNINNKQAILTKIFIEIKGGTFWAPNIQYVELTGIDMITHSIVKEKLKI